MLSVDGDTQVVAKTENGTAQAIKVSGKTTAQFEGNIYADVTSTNSDSTRGISAQQGATLIQFL